MLNPEKISHEELTDLSTSLVICSHFIPWEIQKKVILFVNIIIHML